MLLWGAWASGFMHSLPYSDKILQVFNFTNFEQFAKLFQQNFLHFRIDSRVHRPAIHLWTYYLSFRYFKSVDEQYPGSKSPDSRGALSKQVLVCDFLRQTAVLICRDGAKVRGAYLTLSAKKAEIGKQAGEHGALATVRY